MFDYSRKLVADTPQKIPVVGHYIYIVNAPHPIKILVDNNQELERGEGDCLYYRSGFNEIQIDSVITQDVSISVSHEKQTVKRANKSANSKNRFINLIDIATTSYASISNATPTLADGSQLVKWTFPNIKAQILDTQISYPTTHSGPILGFACAYNQGSDAAAGVAINDALKAGNIARVTVAPVHGNSDRGNVFFISSVESSFIKDDFPTEITDFYITPCAISGTPYNSDLVAEFKFRER